MRAQRGERRKKEREMWRSYNGDNSRRLGKWKDYREIPVVPKFIKRVRCEK
jgi:hypothetical protein